MGRVIADAVCALWENLKPCEAARVRGCTKKLYTQTRTDGMERYDEAKAFCEAYRLDHSARGTLNIAEAMRIVEIRERAPIFQKIPVSVIEIGGLLIAGIGAEPFTKYGYAIRELAAHKALTMTACLMNGYECYMPKNITIEGLHVDDSKATSGYTSVYLLCNPDINWWNKTYEAKVLAEGYMYHVPENITISSFTSETGKTWRLASNTFMYRNTVVNNLDAKD
jgi:hypothetical protein